MNEPRAPFDIAKKYAFIVVYYGFIPFICYKGASFKSNF